MGKEGIEEPGDGLWQEEEADVATVSHDRPVPPRRFKVLLLNDDYTTMEFVVHVLVDVFLQPYDSAVDIMLRVHNEGSGLAGIYSREVAETKIARVTELARDNEFPLRCTMEPE